MLLEGGGTLGASTIPGPARSRRSRHAGCDKTACPGGASRGPVEALSLSRNTFRPRSGAAKFSLQRPRALCCDRQNTRGRTMTILALVTAVLGSACCVGVSAMQYSRRHPASLFLVRK